jgi:hypothetical protein
MGFAPIEISDYIRRFLKNNPRESAHAVRARLESALADYKAGYRCNCGAPIWVIGSSEVGNACFTCITGEADPSEDYEIAGACDKRFDPKSRLRGDGPARLASLLRARLGRRRRSGRAPREPRLGGIR